MHAKKLLTDWGQAHALRNNKNRLEFSSLNSRQNIEDRYNPRTFVLCFKTRMSRAQFSREQACRI